MSLVAHVTDWGSLVAIFGPVLVGGHAFETEFVFLKKVLPFSEGKFLELVAFVQSVGFHSVKETQYLMSGDLGVLISGLSTLALLVPRVKAHFRHVFLNPLLWRKEFITKWRLRQWKFTMCSRDLCRVLVNLRYV